MFVDFLLERMQQNPTKDALIWRDDTFSYSWLRERIRYWRRRLAEEEVKPGSVVALEADFSPNSVALFLSLTRRGCTLVPLTSSVEQQKPEFRQIAQVEVSCSIDERDEVQFSRTGLQADHPYYEKLREDGRPGLVLFSSGSTGKSKAAVHDLSGLLEKFQTPRHSFRSLTFLLYDHIGGVNTMLYNLSNAGCLITVQGRDPDEVLRAIERYKVELLPTSPTFLNLILLSEAYKRHDLSSLQLVTYGTEPMLESTLRSFHQLFPEVRLLQTYGLSEVGILRSKSKSSDSLWVRLGGDGFETRIVAGILHIRARSAMFGYLNAPSPFTEDGWFNTGDEVEVDGEYLRILGRKSEIINVGGEKVYPAEVESVLQDLDGVAEAAVYSEKNVILGNIVCARVTPQESEQERGETDKEFVTRLKKICRKSLQSFKVPVKIQLTDSHQHGERFKKMRPLET
jgi:acyl-coenzyme A synthetase/AMP-(fatty) acid ligase